MAQDILKEALSEAAKHEAKKIQKIGVKIGGEHFAESDSLQFCMEAVAKGTIAEGAKIEVEVTITDTKCPKCGFVFPVETHLPVCPGCGNRDLAEPIHDHSTQITLELG